MPTPCKVLKFFKAINSINSSQFVFKINQNWQKMFKYKHNPTRELSIWFQSQLKVYCGKMKTTGINDLNHILIIFMPLMIVLNI